VVEVGFYHLTRSRLEEALPQLLEKALERGLKAVLVVRDGDHLTHLDEVLWTYRPESFLAHGTATTGFAERQPIFLARAIENPNGASLLVLVDGLMPPADVPFARIVDLFDGADEAAVASARNRWREWRERGTATLVYWQQRADGGWSKARAESPATS
jgi:DNA polymerase-3 subunit chi